MKRFDKSDYNENPKASCRIRVDYMITTCKMSYLGTFAASDTDRESTTPSLKVSSANSNRPPSL